MTSSISSKWLVPEKLPNGLKFQCSTNLATLVSTNCAALFFRPLVKCVEEEHNLINSHFKIQHHRKKIDFMEVFVFAGDDQTKQEVKSAVVCSSCDVGHELSQTTLLSEQKYTYSWLDCRNRPKLILTPKRHIERLCELNDENGETEAFWRDAVEVINRECGNVNELNYPLLAINHGTFRKHAHLHLKIDVTKDIWENVIIPRHRDKIDRLKHLLKQVELVKDCFTKEHLEKEIQKGVIGN